MALSNYDDNWNVEALFDGVIWCPCCGSEDFTLIPGMGFWCDECNTQARLRFPGGDDGFLVDFDSSAMWGGEGHERIPGDYVMAKVLGTKTPELYYWGTPRVDGEDVEWSPVDRRVTA